MKDRMAGQMSQGSKRWQSLCLKNLKMRCLGKSTPLFGAETPRVVYWQNTLP